MTTKENFEEMSCTFPTTRTEKRALVLTPFTSPNGWQTLADGSRPIPIRATTRVAARTAISEPVIHTEAALLQGKIISINWQGGLIQIDGEDPKTVSYHKSDVWVDDKKVKQLPREGDTVSFYLVCDEGLKKEKAEQVTVINQVRSPNFNNTPISNKSHTSPKNSSLEGASPSAVRSPLNPTAPSFRPKSTSPPSPNNGSTCELPNNVSRGASPDPQCSPHSADNEDKKMESNEPSFLHEHCTGTVTHVSVPNGLIRLDNAPDHVLIPYHYSDVWDDGKCVKQFPREGDTVSCYIGLDLKTKKEKAEMVKVVYKKHKKDVETPARKQVHKVIQNAHVRSAVSVSKGGNVKPGRESPGSCSPKAAVHIVTSPVLRYGPPPLMGPMFPIDNNSYSLYDNPIDDFCPSSPGPMPSYTLGTPSLDPALLNTNSSSFSTTSYHNSMNSPSFSANNVSPSNQYLTVSHSSSFASPHNLMSYSPHCISEPRYSNLDNLNSDERQCYFSNKVVGTPIKPKYESNTDDLPPFGCLDDGTDCLAATTAEAVLKDDFFEMEQQERISSTPSNHKHSKSVTANWGNEDEITRQSSSSSRCAVDVLETLLPKSPIINVPARRNSNPFHYVISTV